VIRSQSIQPSRFGVTLGSLLLGSLAAGALGTFGVTPARAEATILVEAQTGKVLEDHNATYPWYPASLSKLMTLYVTLSAIRDHRITFDTLFAVSRDAAAQAPTKMGFPIGTQVTVDNAIKMMMVKSANDMAVLLAEGIDGSIDNFAQEMTETAHRLGMSETNYVNPNGLPADGQITSARDLAILARALIREFPQYSLYWHIPAIQYGRRITRNYNPLIGRFPGADGMKTGFICASGFNLVATANQRNKELIVVVLGAPSGAARAVKAAELLEGGFKKNPLAWLVPSPGTVDQLQPIESSPPDLKDEMCGPHRKRMRQADEDDDETTQASAGDYSQQFSVLLSALRAPTAKNEKLLPDSGPVVPIVVYTGPTRPPGERPAPRARTTAEHATAEHKTAEHKTAGHKTAEHKTAEHTTAEHTTAAHTTAAHTTAEHTTAEHKTAEHKTAEHTTAAHTTASHSAASHTPVSQTTSEHVAAHARPPQRPRRPAVPPKSAD
jgi:D-alanyl-D-alanine carboxypeptidase